jgi:hypothetical protein
MNLWKSLYVAPIVEKRATANKEPAHGRRLDADWHKLGAEERGCDAGLMRARRGSNTCKEWGRAGLVCKVECHSDTQGMRLTNED